MLAGFALIGALLAATVGHTAYVMFDANTRVKQAVGARIAARSLSVPDRCVRRCFRASSASPAPIAFAINR